VSAFDFADPASEALATAVIFGDPLRAPWARRVLRRYRQMFGCSAIDWSRP